MDSNRPLLTWLTRLIHLLDKINPFTRGLNAAGLVILCLWVFYTFIDVLLRYIINRPFPGSIELGSAALAVIVFLGVAYTQLHKGHIRVDIITSRLSPRAAIAWDAATYIVSIATVSILTWRGIEYTLWLTHTKEVSGMLRIPLGPAAAIVPIGCLFYLLVLLRDFFGKVVEGLNIGFQKSTWFLTFFTPALVLALAALWMYTSWMSPSFVGVLGLVIMFVFTFLAMPIPIVFSLVAFVFVGHLCGPSAGFEVAGAGLYGHVADYSWSVIALFVLMAFFIVGSELGADAYSSAYKWFGHVRGGLAIATVAGSTALAAVVGDPASSTITMGTVALPEMKKFKYADSLATGTVAAGATLGPMIPPSIGFIIYGILTGESIGKLFIAGVIPGLLLAASFVIAIYIGCLRDPELGPPGERSSWGDRLKSLKVSGPIALLFIIVIGGIYSGIFSAIEGGGIGAFMAFVIALAMRRITWQKFKFALVEAGKIISAIIFLIGTGLMFGVVLGASNLSTMLVELIGKLPVSPIVVVAAILFVYLLLGCIMDAPIILILTVPLLTPIAKALRLDMIWFGVLLVLMTNLGMITPPYGMNVFMLRRIAKDVSITTIFRGVMPFVLCTLVVAVLILFFPQLATWLPYLLK